MIWTIMPEESVISSSTGVPPQLKKIKYNNVNVLCYPISESQMCVVRIISSDPKDYLKKELQPGNIIESNKGIVKF